LSQFTAFVQSPYISQPNSCPPLHTKGYQQFICLQLHFSFFDDDDDEEDDGDNNNNNNNNRCVDHQSAAPNLGDRAATATARISLENRFLEYFAITWSPCAGCQECQQTFIPSDICAIGK
jgi:hypothetical protein